MTTRDRRLAKADRLRDYAGRREAKQDTLNEAARTDEDATGIPFGQPILVGHHSERRHRRAIERMDRAMGAAVDNANTAEEQRRRAENIEAAANRAIYDDDPDALERLTAKLAALEEQRETMKAENAAYRRNNKDRLKAMTPYERHHAVPFPAYALSNLSGVIGNTKKRIQILSQPERGRPMIARRDGDCRNCSHGVTAGEQIKWFRRAGAAEHATCPE